MCKGDGPEGALWQVVGGGASGGLIVRDGQGTSAPEADCRLSTGALVRQLALDGGRLRYELVTGDGPLSGWVSTSYRGKDLVARLEDVTEQQQQRLALQQYAGRFGRPAAGDEGPDRPGSQRRAFSWRADAQHEAPARPEERARGELERALGLAAACAGGAGASAEDSDGEEVQLCGHCRLPLGERVYTSSGSKVPLHEECVSEFMVRSLSEQEASRLREEQKLKSATRAEYGIGWKHEALGNHSTPQGMCCMVLDPASGSVRIAPTMEPAAAVNLEYLSTALKVRRDEGREPYFSLDPTGTEWARGAMQEKRFEPEWLAGTSVGEVMFQADYHLKELSMGEHEQPVVGMKSCWQLEDSDRANEDEWNAREWFVVREADVQMTEDGALVPFVKMGVEAREQIETASGLEDAPITKPEHPLVRYAQAFSKNFDLIAERRSVVYHLRELAKASVLAKFLLEAEVPLEESWFGLSRVVEPACSLEVPQLWNERYHAAIAVQGGGVEEQVVAPQVRGVYGGVQFGLERFSVGARAASTSVQLGRVGARGPMPRVSAALSMATSVTGGLRAPGMRAAVSMRAGGVPRGVQFGLERFTVGARAAAASVQFARVGARGPMPRVSAALSMATSVTGGLRTPAMRGVDLSLDDFDLSTATVVKGGGFEALRCAPLAAPFWAGLEDGAVFQGEDAALLRQVFHPALSDRREEGDRFAPPDASRGYVEGLRQLVNDEAIAQDQRRRAFLSAGFRAESPGPEFPLSWQATFRLDLGKASGGSPQRGPLHPRPDYKAHAPMFAQVLRSTEPAFDKSTEEGTRFRVYSVGGLEVRTTQQLGGEEVVGAVFSVSPPPGGLGGRLGTAAVAWQGEAADIDERVVKATQYVERAEQARFHYYVVLETERGRLVVAEASAAGGATWDCRPSALEARGSRARVVRTASCHGATVGELRGAAAATLDTLDQPERGGHGRGPSSGKRFARGVLELAGRRQGGAAARAP